MQLLLWACVLGVALAKKRFAFTRLKPASSSEEDYYGNHYPLNPSLKIPDDSVNDNLPPLLLPPLHSRPDSSLFKYPWVPESESEVPPYLWIQSSPRIRSIDQDPSNPAETSLNVLGDTVPLPPPSPPSRPYPILLPSRAMAAPAALSMPTEPATTPAARPPTVPESVVAKLSEPQLPEAEAAAAQHPLPEPAAPYPAEHRVPTFEPGAVHSAEVTFPQAEPAAAQHPPPKPAVALPSPAHLAAVEPIEAKPVPAEPSAMSPAAADPVAIQSEAEDPAEDNILAAEPPEAKPLTQDSQPTILAR